jgi:two-component system sensor histidine kinase/response regulator
MDSSQTTTNILNAIDDIAGLGLFEYQADTNTLSVSDGWRRIFEVDADYIPTMQGAMNFYNEPFQSELIATAKEFTTLRPEQYTDQTFTKESSITTGLGNKRWIRHYLKRFMEQGRIVSRGFVQDISAEVEQRVTTQQFKDLYNHAPYGYHTTTLDGLITNMNFTMLKYLGYSIEEVKNTVSIQDILTPRSLLIRSNLRDQLWENGGFHDIELEFVRKDGTIFLGLVNASLVRTEAGEPIAIRVATIDLSERKQLERAQQQAETTEEVHRLRSEFLNMISHEFRTPLGVVIGVADALQAHVDEEGRQYLDMLEANGNRLLTMLNNVLELAKTEFDSRAVTPVQRMDIQYFCAQFHEEWAVQMEQHGIEYILEILPTVPRMVLVDKLRLERVLTSLMGNAVKFTQNGFVRLVVNYSENSTGSATLHLRLQDTGIGIANEHLEKIFEPFYQVHQGGTTRSYDGAGIGLTVVRSLIRQMKGTLQINSIVGSGTTITLNVPVVLS